MLQVVHDVNGGKTRVLQVPAPIATSGGVVVANACSVISAGTERHVVKLAQSSLISKARQRPDHVRRVLQKLRDEGVFSTLTQVRAKLQEPLALGYSSAGVVLSLGAGVHDLKVGDRVAVSASHAAVVVAGRNLCAAIPEGVSLEEAAYAPLGAIALQGVRLAQAEIGSRVLVIGLGLLGLFTVALLKAQGSRVWGIDVEPSRVSLAGSFGADGAGLASERVAVLANAGPEGFDAVIITAAAADNSTLELAADVVRTRGRIIAVGLVGLNVPREAFFRKEVELTVSHSLGVGRGDARYESSPADYPIGQARWTVRRNIETVLETMAAGRLPVRLLTSHRFKVESADKAYELITKSEEPHLGVVLDYDDAARHTEPRVSLSGSAPTTARDAVRVSVIGAGNFARLVMLPKLANMNGIMFRGLCTSKGLNAADTGARYGFGYATSEANEIFADAETDAVIIATRHDLHASLVIGALRAGKHVFVEKPLCLTPDEVAAISELISSSHGRRQPILMVGFNRRFAVALQSLANEFNGIRPLSVSYRFSVPVVPPESWVHDDEVGGGRIIGEACHAIDACAAIVGSVPVRVFAESAGPSGTLARSDDRVFITLRHLDGSISSVSYQAGGDRSAPSERIEIIGGGKTAVLDNWSELSVWSDGRKRRPVRLSPDKGHAAALATFVDACRNGGAQPIPLDHLLATSLASILAERSTREGVPFELNLA